MESSRRDLSIQRVVKGWFCIFDGENSISHSFLVACLKKKHVFVTNSVKFGRTEVSIPPMESSRRDLSIQRVVKGWFSMFGEEQINCSFILGRCFKEKNTCSSRNRSGRGFMSSPLVEITAYVWGLRKSRF